jgi:PHD/YefM family antitoxin component YafN of YafNO toxin-antitoxin module
MATHEQYVIDEAGKRTAVLVPLQEWERIQAELEELADIRAYDEAKRHPSDPVPFEQAMAEIESNTGE